MATVELTNADDGGVIDVHVGDTIVLRLEDNPTTGYQWELEQPAGDQILVADYSYLPAADRMGSGGTATWRLRADSAGTLSVRLKRWRPWEGESSTVARFVVTIAVRA